MAGKRALPKHLYRIKDHFVARLLVPERLRGILGASQFSKSLGSDRVAAERALPGVVAGYYAKIEEAERKLDPAADPEPVQRISPVEMARIHFDEQVAHDEAERNAGSLVGGILFEAGYADTIRRTASGEASAEEMDAALGWRIDDFRARGFHNERYGSPQWRLLARTLARGEAEFLRRRSALDHGRAPPEPSDPVVISPPVPVTPTPSAPIAPLTPYSTAGGGGERLTDLFKAYVKERQASGGGFESERRWEPVFKNIYEFMRAKGRSDDANSMTKSDFIDWKEHFIASGLSMKTIKDVYLASLKAVMRWAHENDRIENNFSASVRVKVARVQIDREKGHTLDEAKQILAVALHHRSVDTGNPQTTEGAHMTAAKKWVPWLAAHTGARVAELTQLRKQDIVVKDGIDCILITPDAGSTKTGMYRYVPIHEQLIALGFLEFVDKSKGALFYDDTSGSSSKTSKARTVAGRISQWLRAKKIVSPEVDPNHGWRHRFKTIARELGCDARIFDAIQGHAARTASDDYGDVTVVARKNVIDRMPFYDVK